MTCRYDYEYDYGKKEIANSIRTHDLWHVSWTLIIIISNELLEQYLMQFILQTYSENIG